MGRRTGRYGTLLLATYDSDEDSFSSICKVGTGFTDEHLDQIWDIQSRLFQYHVFSFDASALEMGENYPFWDLWPQLLPPIWHLNILCYLVSSL